MDGGPGLSKAAQIARAAERGGSAKRATRQARAHATGNQNNRRQKRDGRTHGTAWNYGVPERLGQHAGCGPRRAPRPHQAAHGAGRGRHPRKGGRHHRKGRESASLADHKRDRRARRASGHAPPRLLRPLPPGDAGLPRAHCVLRRRSGQPLQKRRTGYVSKRMLPGRRLGEIPCLDTSRRAPVVPYSSRLLPPPPSPPSSPTTLLAARRRALQPCDLPFVLLFLWLGRAAARPNRDIDPQRAPHRGLSDNTARQKIPSRQSNLVDLRCYRPSPAPASPGRPRPAHAAAGAACGAF